MTPQLFSAFCAGVVAAVTFMWLLERRWFWAAIGLLLIAINWHYALHP
jgi:hypothetical protein